MMISKFNGITVTDNIVSNNNIQYRFEYLTGEAAYYCLRSYDNGHFVQTPNVRGWAFNEEPSWFEVIHQYDAADGYYHGLLITNGNEVDLVAIITPDNRMHIIGSNEEAIDLN